MSSKKQQIKIENKKNTFYSFVNDTASDTTEIDALSNDAVKIADKANRCWGAKKITWRSENFKHSMRRLLWWTIELSSRRAIENSLYLSNDAAGTVDKIASRTWW